MDDRSLQVLISLCDSFQIRQLQGQVLAHEELLLRDQAARCLSRVLQCVEELTRRQWEKLNADEPQAPPPPTT